MKTLKANYKMDNRGSINDINGISRPTPRRPLVTPSRASAERPKPSTVTPGVAKKPALPTPTEPLMPTRPAAPLVPVEINAKSASSSNKPWIILTIVMAIIAVATLGYIVYILLLPE